MLRISPNVLALIANCLQTACHSRAWCHQCATFLLMIWHKGILCAEDGFAVVVPSDQNTEQKLLVCNACNVQSQCRHNRTSWCTLRKVASIIQRLVKLHGVIMFERVQKVPMPHALPVNTQLTAVGSCTCRWFACVAAGPLVNQSRVQPFRQTQAPERARHAQAVPADLSSPEGFYRCSFPSHRPRSYA